MAARLIPLVCYTCKEPIGVFVCPDKETLLKLVPKKYKSILTYLMGDGDIDLSGLAGILPVVCPTHSKGEQKHGNPEGAEVCAQEAHAQA